MLDENYGVIVCLSVALLSLQVSSLYLYSEGPLSRDEAHIACERYEGGALAVSNEGLEQWIKTRQSTIPKSWIGDHTVLSPWMQMKGCYSPDSIADYEVHVMSNDGTGSGIDHVTNWSVGTCQRLCSGTKLFAIQDKKCFCLRISEKRLSTLGLRVSDDRCRFFCTEGSGGACGGRSGVSVYQTKDDARRASDQTMTSSPPLCSVLNTKTRRFSPLNCSASAGTICAKFNTESKRISYQTYYRKTDWFGSRKYCRKQTALLPGTWTAEMTERGLYWTGRFRELLIINQQFDLDAARVSCQSLKYDQGTFNLMSRSCDHTLPFICQLNSTSLGSTEYDTTSYTKTDRAVRTTSMTTFFNNADTPLTTTNSGIQTITTTDSKESTIKQQEFTTIPHSKISELAPIVKVSTKPRIGNFGRANENDVTPKTVVKKNSSYTLAVLVIFSCAFVSLIIIFVLIRQMRKNNKRTPERNVVNIQATFSAKNDSDQAERENRHSDEGVVDNDS